MNLRETIASIGEMHGLKIDGESYETKIRKSIVEILNQIPKDKKVAIRGAGTHTSELLSLEGCSARFECILDYAVKENDILRIKEQEWPLYPSSAIDQLDIDVVVISSYTRRKEIREELQKNEKPLIIIDLYDELQKMDLDVNAPFYYNTEDTYDNVIYYRKAYLANQDARNLKNLIVAYLKIFDFINFEYFSKKYICNRYEDYQNVQKALHEIRAQLDDVKEQLKKRTQRDIITIWNDQVDYNDLQYTSYIQEESKNSMFFENAYTMTPFTVPTFLEMFQGLKSIDDRIYFNRHSVSDKDNSEVIRELEAAGYEFVYIGDEADAKLFKENNVMSHFTYNSSCVRCMDLLQKLLDAQKPVCMILHELVETHNPYLNGELSSAKWYEWPTFAGSSEAFALEQKKKSLAYWDKQLAFYMEFVPDNCIKIFMSDHGTRYNYQPIYKEPSTHILFFITGRDVPQKKCKGLFSIYNYNKVIQSIIKNEYKDEKIFSDYVLMQETNIFNSTALRYYIKNNAEECTCGWRAVRTQNELFVKLSSGKKYYYLLPDEDSDCLSQADPERIKQLDELAGDKFEDTSEYERELAFFRKQFETHE
ncbi:MAG: hypothetical protein K2J90_05400 [Lachnospiraceae bacterium]|nr:hypothetical protein [Lachnospiraceae bacterium]